MSPYNDPALMMIVKDEARKMVSVLAVLSVMLIARMRPDSDRAKLADCPIAL